MKKTYVLVSLILVAVLLTGCLAPKVYVKISPNPIKINPQELYADDFNVKGLELILRTSGFSANYRIEGATVTVIDDEENPVFEPRVIEIDRETPIIPGIKLTIPAGDVSLRDLFDYDGEPTEEEFIAYYNENWKGKTYKLTITIEGENPTTDTADIKFE